MSTQPIDFTMDEQKRRRYEADELLAAAILVEQGHASVQSIEFDGQDRQRPYENLHGIQSHVRAVHSPVTTIKLVHLKFNDR